MKRTCKQCGKEFELSDSEISFYKSKGLELPKRCQACRNQNKVRDSHTGQKDTGQRAKDLPQGSRRNGSNENHKNSVIITAVAVLLLLVVFVVKNIFTLPSEEAVPTTDVASLEASLEMSQPEQQEFVQEPLPDLVSEAFEDEQQASTLWQSEVESRTGLQASDEEHPQPSEEQTEQTPTESQISAETVPEALQEASGVTYKFRKAQYLTEHFEKHAADFSYTTEEEYLEGANRVIQNPEALHKLEAEDGDDVYFVESTNEFVVVSTDGYIRTYFKANIDYYNRQ